MSTSVNLLKGIRKVNLTLEECFEIWNQVEDVSDEVLLAMRRLLKEAFPDREVCELDVNKKKCLAFLSSTLTQGEKDALAFCSHAEISGKQFKDDAVVASIRTIARSVNQKLTNRFEKLMFQVYGSPDVIPTGVIGFYFNFIVFIFSYVYYLIVMSEAMRAKLEQVLHDKKSPVKKSDVKKSGVKKPDEKKPSAIVAEAVDVKEVAESFDAVSITTPQAIEGSGTVEEEEAPEAVMITSESVSDSVQVNPPCQATPLTQLSELEKENLQLHFQIDELNLKINELQTRLTDHENQLVQRAFECPVCNM